MSLVLEEDASAAQLRETKKGKARAILENAKFRTTSDEKKIAAINYMLENGLTSEDLYDVAANITRDFVRALPDTLEDANLEFLQNKRSLIRNVLSGSVSLGGRLHISRSPLLVIELAETEEILRLVEARRREQEEARKQHMAQAQSQKQTLSEAMSSKTGLRKPITITQLEMRKLTTPLKDVEVARLKRRERELGERMMKQVPGWETDAQELNYIVSRLEQNRQLTAGAEDAVPKREKVRPTVIRLPQSEAQQRQPSPQRKTLERKQLSPQRVLEPLPEDELVDSLAAAVELTDLEQAVAQALQRETNLFGRTGAFIRPLQDLQFTVGAVRNQFVNAVDRGGVAPKLPLSEYLRRMENWKTDLKKIIAQQLAMGRRCNNESDPISFTDIADLDDGEFIRLENGDCWEVASLLDFIRSRNGKNDATSLKNASSRTIWRDDIELNRILQHPEAIRSGFTKWFNEKNSVGAADLVSPETMRRMVVAASLLLSRGPDFEQALSNSLNDKQRRALEQAGGNYGYIRDYELRLEVELIVSTTLKSTAVVDFYNYYLGLSQDERDALNTFDKEFENNLVACSKGNYCVFGLGDMLLVTRNSIAELKKMPPVNLGSRFH